jgi:hypothetical protein
MLAVSAIVVVAGVAGYLGTRGPTPLPNSVHPLLPDLVMAPIEVAMGGLQELTGDPVVRVEATIVDRGAGDFLTSARRDVPWSNDWTVYQRIAEAGGGFTERATPAELLFAGAPHSHWHIQNMEAHRLERIDTGEILHQVIKQGFCPYDTDQEFPDLPGSPAQPVHLEPDCEGPAWTTSLTMGVSVGWGDKYPWHMIEQSIDIAGVPDGRYRIREIADPSDWFRESDETNNETWVDVDIVTSGGIPTVTVTGRAP